MKLRLNRPFWPILDCFWKSKFSKSLYGLIWNLSGAGTPLLTFFSAKLSQASGLLHVLAYFIFCQNPLKCCVCGLSLTGSEGPLKCSKLSAFGLFTRLPCMPVYDTRSEPADRANAQIIPSFVRFVLFFYNNFGAFPEFQRRQNFYFVSLLARLMHNYFTEPVQKTAT